MSDAIIVAVIAGLTGGGISQLIIFLIQRRDAKKANPMADMLKGLGHDRIIELGTKYIQRGDITKDEFENLNDYLYKPYEELGGNGTAEKIMTEVRKLPLKG
jgi:hypothetical protein